MSGSLKGIALSRRHPSRHAPAPILAQSARRPLSVFLTANADNLLALAL